MSTEELAPVAGPRRYRVCFNCRADAVGAVIGLLIKEVESPKMETIGENYKLTLICMHDQLRTVIDMVLDDADQLVIAPFVPEVKMGPATFIAPRNMARVVTPLQRDVTLLPAQRRRLQGGYARVSDTPVAIALLKAFDDGRRVVHYADLAEALVTAGYSAGSAGKTSSELVEEGTLVRIGRGAYRLPTTQDELSRMEARDPSFSSKPGE